MKLMVSKTLDLDSRELSTCTVPTNSASFQQTGGDESPSTPKMNPWEHFVVPCVDIMRETERKKELEDSVVPCV